MRSLKLRLKLHELFNDLEEADLTPEEVEMVEKNTVQAFLEQSDPMAVSCSYSLTHSRTH